MAAIETHSNEKEVGSLQSSANQPHIGARNLDERRRNALAQIDNATFSLVIIYFSRYFYVMLSSHSAVGSISKSSVSLALASLLMRKWRARWHYLIVHLKSILFRYDIFAINIAATMLGYVYTKSHALNTNQDLGVKVATPIGTLFGQLLFGWLADVVGRKRMCMSFYYWPCAHNPHKP